ncbi:MAG: RepB family DNA primase [Candidatus Thiodiazotropha sp. (ex Dulcina madagascariensis)]|nr:RepB family DNA primase [Candidatus Thiodiazotropha sp. (ex Dulcina madagascariensis)]MCU7926804.1 RepB family DNA primase [Candidatus Thiodiazotropha sp. (ex Dulcina madagascariensis)]
MTGRFNRDPCISHVARWIECQGCRLYPVREQAECFLARLDPRADYFSFRTFSDTGYTRAASHDPLERAIHGSLAACWRKLAQLNRQGAVITVTINQTNGKGRDIVDIRRVRALFLDDDLGGDSGRFPLEPHIQVETSAAHYHYYWLVQDIPLQDFPSCQQRLATRYGGDTRVQALNQSMQLPGFWRRKRVVQPCFPRLLKTRGEAAYGQRDVERLIDPFRRDSVGSRSSG